MSGSASGLGNVLGLSSAGLSNNPGPAPLPPSDEPGPTPTARQFRAMFPEFSDSSTFLDEVICMWLSLYADSLNACRWKQYYNYGIFLATAHAIALGRQAQKQVATGMTPGYGVGVISGKSAGSVSISYDTSAGRLDGGGDWNLTVYGIRFLGLARMIGSGGVQIRGADAMSVSEAALLRGDTGLPFNL